jgi:hypothetical protein
MIATTEPEFLIDDKGNKTKVLLNYDNYIEMLELIEDLQDSKAIDAVQNEPEIPFAEYKRKREIV